MNGLMESALCTTLRIGKYMARKAKKKRQLTPDQRRFNRETVAKKGNLKSVAAKRYLFGHFTNRRKGRA